MTTDLAGGFDNIDTNKLLDIMTQQGCERELVIWTRRWMSDRGMRLRFNGRISKRFDCSKGVPQGSPLSPYLFCKYVKEVFALHFHHSPHRSRLTMSYVDNGTIMIAGHNCSTVIHEMKETYLSCRQIAKEIGMDFGIRKTEWMGFESEQWDGMEIDRDVLMAVKEIRILGYRFNTANNDKAHVDYWIERFGSEKENCGSGEKIPKQRRDRCLGNHEAIQKHFVTHHLVWTRSSERRLKAHEVHPSCD